MHSLAIFTLAFFELQRGNAMNSVVLFAMAVPFLMDAALGINILRVIFGQETNEPVCYDDLLENPDQEASKEFNDRLPEILKKGKVAEKMFTKGWKFDMFNVQGQSNKQIAAVTVIFAQMYFSIIEMIMGEHQTLAILVLTYSLICLFAFFNLTYIRDFDAIQINATPMILSMAAILSIMGKFDVCTFGMALALIADGYFALRFKDSSDKIKYTPIELFAIESWT